MLRTGILLISLGLAIAAARLPRSARPAQRERLLSLVGRAPGLRIRFFLASTALCATCANLDVHFAPDQISSGLGYWKYGVGSKPIYSLHWIGNTVG